MENENDLKTLYLNEWCLEFAYGLSTAVAITTSQYTGYLGGG